MRKYIMAIAAIVAGVVALGSSDASAQQFRCGYNIRCPQPQVMQQRVFTQRRVVSYRIVTVRRPIFQTVRRTVVVPVVQQQVEAPCPTPVVQRPICNSCGQQVVARANFATAPVNQAAIGAPTGNSCDKNNPQPYQRDGKWFICR